MKGMLFPGSLFALIIGLLVGAAVAAIREGGHRHGTCFRMRYPMFYFVGSLLFIVANKE